MSAEEIERKVSTGEKLQTLLPRLMGRESIKGKLIWQKFMELKSVRDASIHFKTCDQYPIGGDLTPRHVIYKMINGDPMIFPRTAIATIAHFAKQEPPRWLRHLVEKHGTNLKTVAKP